MFSRLSGIRAEKACDTKDLHRFPYQGVNTKQTITPLVNSSLGIASLTFTGNRHQEQKQHKRTCPHCVHDSPSLSLFLSVCTKKVYFLSLLVVSGCLTLIFPLTLIRGSGWTDELPVDWDVGCVNFKASYNPSTPTESLTDCVVFDYFLQNLTKLHFSIIDESPLPLTFFWII